jgi:ArsR family transcriptional regulator, arsenate/arsenite/antimonite-responsive transcriptional repressor
MDTSGTTTGSIEIDGADGAPRLDQVAHALSDPLRVSILDLLAAGRCEDCMSPANPELPEAICALDMQGLLGNISATKLSYHMKELRNARLVREHKQGKWIYYELDKDALGAFARQVKQRFL